MGLLLSFSLALIPTTLYFLHLRSLLRVLITALGFRHKPESSDDSVGGASAVHRRGGGFPSCATEDKSSQRKLPRTRSARRRWCVILLGAEDRGVPTSAVSSSTERHVPVNGATPGSHRSKKLAGSLMFPSMLQRQFPTITSSTQVPCIDEDVDVLVAMRDSLMDEESRAWVLGWLTF